MIHQLGDKTVIRDGHNWIADSAKVIGNIHLKNESSVWFGAVLRGDIEKITLGEGSNIQDNSIFNTQGKEIYISDRVTIGHNVIIDGNCRINNNAVIGMGSILEENCIIEKNAFVGANSYVKTNTVVPEGKIFAGNPAKYFRDVTQQEK